MYAVTSQQDTIKIGNLRLKSPPQELADFGRLLSPLI
jgi:hypothetical protein